MRIAASSQDLRDIPVIDCDRAFPMATLLAEEARAHELFDLATQRFPQALLRQLDRASRRWLVKWDNAHLSEIDAVAERLARPGAYFFSINYEWGCTCRVAPAPDNASARLVRVLDWKTPGLGRNLVAARVSADYGPFVTLTWPGYTGVLTAMAPGRFSAALNQAPMRRTAGFYVLDWAANRRRVWNMPYPTPAHLLRRVFERAPTFGDARLMLSNHPISTPAIFTLAGLEAKDTAVIERRETEACVHDGANVAANHWQTSGWKGRARGIDSAGRSARMHLTPTALDPEFAWLKPPILNDRTRVVMVSDARRGALLAQGYEGLAAATRLLTLD